MLGCKPDEPPTMELDHPQQQRRKEPDTLLALPAEASGIHAQEAKQHQMFGQRDVREHEPHADHGRRAPVAPRSDHSKHLGRPLLPYSERGNGHE